VKRVATVLKVNAAKVGVAVVVARAGLVRVGVINSEARVLVVGVIREAAAQAVAPPVGRVDPAAGNRSIIRSRLCLEILQRNNPD